MDRTISLGISLLPGGPRVNLLALSLAHIRWFAAFYFVIFTPKNRN